MVYWLKKVGSYKLAKVVVEGFFDHEFYSNHIFFNDLVI